MPRLISEITELSTALGLLGFDSVDRALVAPPAELVDVDAAVWRRLTDAWSDRSHTADFLAAFANGRAMLAAEDGLRGRPPSRIEWKGAHRSPAQETVPADLRADHVYLISCKYLSTILLNTSPAQLVDRLLIPDPSQRDPDWFATVAAAQLQELYRLVAHHHGRGRSWPARVGDVSSEQRSELRQALGDGWHEDCARAYSELCAAVSDATARRWEARLVNVTAKRSLLWRMLRLGDAPYFVLGSGRSGSVRLRVGTPWDWLRAYELRGFRLTGDGVGQPRVAWRADVLDRHHDRELAVEGHVELRWSHGKFGGRPEAKVYLDTPHARVPGYFPLN